MSIPKLRPVLLGLPADLQPLILGAFSDSDIADRGVETEGAQHTIKLLVEGAANAVFLDPRAENWRDIQELLQFCTLTFPVALFAESVWLATMPDIPQRWQADLRNYYQVRTDTGLRDLREQLQYTIRGCHRYLLKRLVRGNLGQIAKEDLTVADPAEIVQKAEEATKALAEIEKQERSILRDSLGLNAEQMRALFDQALQHARDTARRSEIANLVTLGAGVLLVLGVAVDAVVRQSADPWTFATGGMGAAAAIAALVTSPGRRVASGASRLIYVQTAYFSFLSQVRLLNAAGPETVLQRSERLEKATSTLLDQLRGEIGRET